MISVVICAPNAARAQAISAHVAATIGVPHELLLVPDAAAQGGMCPAYNSAAARAQYDMLCFMHDDVELYTPGWGQRVLAHFAADASLGLLGLAGSRYKCAALSGWASGRPAYDCCNVLQTAPGAPARVWMPPGPAGENRVPVKTLDGVWLCTRKAVWQQVRFSSAITGFHFYDIDFSLRVSRHFTVAVAYDIDLLHFSKGNFGDAWVQQAIRFHGEWNTVPLPASLDAAPAGTETAVQRFWLNRLLKEAIRMPLRRRWLALNKVALRPALWKDGLKFFIYPVYHRLKNGKTS